MSEPWKLAPSSFSRKPNSVASSSSFNETTEILVNARDGQRRPHKNQGDKVAQSCPSLLVSRSYVHDADVVFQFLYYKECGLLPETLTHLAHLDNIVLLCADCHTVFDNSIPTLAVIPTDLDYFIRYEQSDYEKRIVRVDTYTSTRIPVDSVSHRALGPDMSTNDPINSVMSFCHTTKSFA